MRGIYEITISDKRYFGSCEDFKTREASHRYHLTRGTHHNKRLQNLWNKYSTAMFTFIEEVAGDIYNREQEIIDEHFNQPYCVNLAPIIGGGRVYEPNEKTIQKQMATKKRTGNYGGANENSWKAAAAANTGTKRSSETKQKMRDAKREFIKNNPDFYNNALDRGRRNRWEKECKLFVLVKDGIEHGPYRTCNEVDILSHPSVLALKNGKKAAVKGYSFKFCTDTNFEELVGG